MDLSKDNHHAQGADPSAVERYRMISFKPLAVL